jgi:hypothetical protein
MDGRTLNPQAHLNSRTCLLDLAGAAALRARRLGPRAAFVVAYERLALLAGVAERPSVAVAAVDPEARVVESLLLADRRALIIGRHTRAGLHLGGDSVALRHVAALACFEGQRPVIRLWDLRTGDPFVTADQEPNGAVVADGPIYVGVGGYALWFVPVGGPFRYVPARHADAAWQALPACHTIDRRPPASGVARPVREPRLVAVAIPPTSTSQGSPYRVPPMSITRLGPPLVMGEGDEPEVGWGVLRLVGEDVRERRTVTAERLEQGVLVGRYERCGVTVGTNRVSRVHLLLVRIGADVWALDTASTNGVRRHGVPFTAGILDDDDSLVLGPVSLDWRRIARPEA